MNHLAGRPLDELHELELASRLLEVRGRQGLVRVIGDVAEAMRPRTGPVRPDVVDALGPVMAELLGAVRGGSLTGPVLGLELEGLSPEDQEFESARQLVRFVATAFLDASRAPRTASAPQVARTAATRAAALHLPGALPRLRGRSGALWPSQGRWVRRGRVISLHP